MLNHTFVFSSKIELLSQAKKDNACEEGLEWAKGKDSLETIIKEISLWYRIWCLEKGYSQFIDDCPWERLNGFNWSYILSSQPQFSDRCHWEKLNEYDWIYLLSFQPQLKKFRK